MHNVPGCRSSIRIFYIDCTAIKICLRIYNNKFCDSTIIVLSTMEHKAKCCYFATPFSVSGTQNLEKIILECAKVHFVHMGKFCSENLKNES
jgi:hypothetical protein